MSLNIDPYVTLGISREASADEIKQAYRRIARRLHPDVNHDSLGATAQFQDVTISYELLLDPVRRREYDSQYSRRSSESSFSFNLRVTPSKRSIMPLQEPQVVYLLAEILPDPRAREDRKS